MSAITVRWGQPAQTKLVDDATGIIAFGRDRRYCEIVLAEQHASASLRMNSVVGRFQVLAGQWHVVNPGNNDGAPKAMLTVRSVDGFVTAHLSEHGRLPISAVGGEGTVSFEVGDQRFHLAFDGGRLELPTVDVVGHRASRTETLTLTAAERFYLQLMAAPCFDGLGAPPRTVEEVAAMAVVSTKTVSNTLQTVRLRYNEKALSGRNGNATLVKRLIQSGVLRRPDPDG